MVWKIELQLEQGRRDTTVAVARDNGQAKLPVFLDLCALAGAFLIRDFSLAAFRVAPGAFGFNDDHGGAVLTEHNNVKSPTAMPFADGGRDLEVCVVAEGAQ